MRSRWAIDDKLSLPHVPHLCFVSVHIRVFATANAPASLIYTIAWLIHIMRYGLLKSSEQEEIIPSCHYSLLLRATSKGAKFAHESEQFTLLIVCTVTGNIDGSDK